MKTQNNETASGTPGYVQFVIAPLLMLSVVLLALMAIGLRSMSDLAPMANGAAGLLVFSLLAIWKLVQRWPTMRPPIACALGSVVVVVAAPNVIILMEEHRVASGPAVVTVLILAASTIVLLWRWALRSYALEAAARTTQKSPDGEEPR